MKTFAFLGLALVMCCGCDVDVKDKGKLPQVSVEPGRLPDVDVRGPEVNVGTQQKEVTVPVVRTEKKTITVPDIDVKIPKENDNEPTK